MFSCDLFAFNVVKRGLGVEKQISVAGFWVLRDVSSGILAPKTRVAYGGLFGQEIWTSSGTDTIEYVFMVIVRSRRDGSFRNTTLLQVCNRERAVLWDLKISGCDNELEFGRTKYCRIFFRD